jgi:hypothetical protein
MAMGLSFIKSETCIDADQYFKIVRYIIPFREDRIGGDELQHKFIKMYLQKSPASSFTCKNCASLKI